MPTTHHRRRPSHHTRIYFDLTDTADPRFDGMIEWLIIGALAFAAAALGAVQAWSETVVLAAAAAMTVCVGLKLMSRPDVRFVWSWTYVPLGGFLLLTAAQLVPLPAAVVGAISPHTLELKRSLLGQLPGGAEASGWMTLSFYPEATLGNLRVLLAMSAVYVVAVNTIRGAAQVRRMLLAISAVGAGVALIGMVHLVLGAPRIYWTINSHLEGHCSAPFGNRNHYGQFINLSLGAVVGVLLVQAAQIGREQRRLSLRAGFENAPVNITARVWWLGGAAVVMGVSVFLSLSKGAVVSLLLSAATAAFVAQRRGMRAWFWVLLPLAWAALIPVLYFGYDALSARFEAATDLAAEGRIQILRDLAGAWRLFPVLGSGMGTFEVLFPMFDRSAITELASHAENEYAQVALEGGGIGLALVLAFAVMIWREYARCVRSHPSPMASAAVGLGFGLMAVMVQSVSDFAQHVPAVAMLSAITCALLVNLSAASRQTSMPEPSLRRAQRWPRIVATIGAALAGGWLVFDGINLARAEYHWSEARRREQQIQRQQWRADDNDWARLLIAAGRAAELRPGEIHFHHLLNYYRWKAISQQRDAEGNLLMSEEQVGYARRIVGELLAGLRCCPTYGPSYSLAGQIERNILDEGALGARHLRTAYRLSQTDPNTCFAAGMLEASEGEWPAAMEKLKRAGELMPSCLLEGVESLAGELNRPDLAMELAGKNISAAARVPEVLASRKAPETMVRQARLHLEDLIRMSAAAPDAPAAVVAEAARLMEEAGDHAGAVRYYRRALNADYGRAEWRLRLAQSLWASGMADEAINQARIARRLGAGEADRLLVEWSLRPAEAATRGAATTQPGRK